MSEAYITLVNNPNSGAVLPAIKRNRAHAPPAGAEDKALGTSPRGALLSA